jgi:hypothetical protein
VLTSPGNGVFFHLCDDESSWTTVAREAYS